MVLLDLVFHKLSKKSLRWKKRKRREKKVEKAGTKAAAPSQPDCLDSSRSDHSAGSKESASWQMLRQRFELTRSMGFGRGRKKGKLRARESSQDEPALEKRERERQLKNAKREVISRAEEECRRWKKRKRREKKVEKAGTLPEAAAPSQPARLDGSRSDHLAGSKESASWRALSDRFVLTRSTGLGRGRKKGKNFTSFLISSRGTRFLIFDWWFLIQTWQPP